MARACFYCSKGRMVGHNVSHANNKTPKISLPNVHRVHAIIKGTVRHVLACTRCIRSGAVQKAA